MMDLISGALLLVAFAAQAVAVVATFDGTSPHTDRTGIEQAGDR